MKLTLAKALASVDWTAITNYCASDPRLRMKLNEAVQRLRPIGKWVGTIQDYRVCTDNACLTWVRQIETIEAAWLCEHPLTLRNGWFETLPNSFGRVKADTGIGSQLIDRGDGFVQHTDIVSDSKIALFSANPSDTGKLVLLQGRDSGANWVQTGGGAVNGEQLALVNGYRVSTTIWDPPGLVGVQKVPTLSPVRAFAVDPSCPSGVLPPGPPDPITPFSPIAIAYWEPDETLPNYRRSLVPTLQNAGPCSTSNCNGDPSCEKTQVTVKAKLQFIEAVNPTDYLQIGCLPALKEEVQAIVLAERGQLDASAIHHAVAIRLLEEELSSFEGHGVVQPFKVEDTEMFGAGFVENPVNAWDYPMTR